MEEKIDGEDVREKNREDEREEEDEEEGQQQPSPPRHPPQQQPRRATPTACPVCTLPHQGIVVPRVAIGRLAGRLVVTSWLVVCDTWGGVGRWVGWVSGLALVLSLFPGRRSVGRRKRAGTRMTRSRVRRRRAGNSSSSSNSRRHGSSRSNNLVKQQRPLPRWRHCAELLYHVLRLIDWPVGGRDDLIGLL